MSTATPDILQIHKQPLSYWLATLGRGPSEIEPDAAAIWGQLGEALRGAAALLAEQLKSPNPVVRLQTVQALRDLATQVQPIVALIRTALKECAQVESEETVRTEAVEALSRHIDPQALMPLMALVESLRDPLPAVRISAAAVLSDLGPEARAASSALIQAALRDSDLRVRVQSAVALWHVERRAAVAVPILIAGLKSPDEYLRWIAADCLGDIGAEAHEALPVLHAALSETPQAPMILRSLQLAIERIERGGAG